MQSGEGEVGDGGGEAGGGYGEGVGGHGVVLSVQALYEVVDSFE